MIPLLSRQTIRNKRVLARVDFNVPIARGRLESDFRLRAHLPTIRRLERAGNAVLLLAHHSDRMQTLRPAARALSRLLGSEVRFLKTIPAAMPDGKGVYLLENLRYWPGEEECDRQFAQTLRRLGDYFVNDAFSAAHRRGASLTALPALLPSSIGLLFERELSLLEKVLVNPRRPLVGMFGGVKLETKIPLLRQFVKRADRVLVGGALAAELMQKSAKDPRRTASLASSSKMLLPPDGAYETRGGKAIFASDTAPAGSRMRDIGPASIREFLRALGGAQTIVWNGPLGQVEDRRFAAGTRALAFALARNKKARVIVGGGDTVAFLEHARILSKFKHVSTGGGAMIAYLSGETLPALEAIESA